MIEKNLNKRYNRAWQTANKASKILREQFNVKRVVIFGSTASCEFYNQWSDIDLAVKGIHPHSFYRAVAAVTGFDSEFKIDLIDMEDCRPELLKQIEAEGIDL